MGGIHVFDRCFYFVHHLIASSTFYSIRFVFFFVAFYLCFSTNFLWFFSFQFLLPADHVNRTRITASTQFQFTLNLVGISMQSFCSSKFTVLYAKHRFNMILMIQTSRCTNAIYIDSQLQEICSSKWILLDFVAAVAVRIKCLHANLMHAAWNVCLRMHRAQLIETTSNWQCTVCGFSVHAQMVNKIYDTCLCLSVIY